MYLTDCQMKTASADGFANIQPVTTVDALGETGIYSCMPKPFSLFFLLSNFFLLFFLFFFVNSTGYYSSWHMNKTEIHNTSWRTTALFSTSHETDGSVQVISNFTKHKENSPTKDEASKKFTRGKKVLWRGTPFYPVIIININLCCSSRHAQPG